MTHPASLGAGPGSSLLLAIGIPVAVLALALIAWAVRRRTSRPSSRRGSPAVRVAALAALACTGYSADTSWRFAADFLDMAGTVERAMMFGAAELGLFATALMARENLNSKGNPGLPGTLVWVITGVQVVPAYAESGLVGGTVRAFVGPIMAALLWHLAMGIELHLRTPGAASHGLLATLVREARERLLSRLGIAARDRDAAQITRDRATARAVALATRLAERTGKQQKSWRGQRITRQLAKAVDRASVGTDPRQRAQLLDQLAARRHALALATVPLRSPWSEKDRHAPGVPVPAARAQLPILPLRDRGPTPTKPGTEPTGDRGPTPTKPGTEPTGDRGPTPTKPGTEPTGDRGPTPTKPGTEPTGDRGPTPTKPGTEPTGDRGPKVASRKTKKVQAPGNSRSKERQRGPRKKRAQRVADPAVELLVELAHPFVPDVLARDGNESLTRVQLREIIRVNNLPGVRNERIGSVLHRLWSEESTNTNARSPQ